MAIVYNSSSSGTSTMIPTDHVSVQEKGLTVHITIISLLSLWIIISNLIVLSCVTTIRHSVRNFAYLQILTLSITDMLVGIFAFPVALSYYIMGSFQQYCACAAILGLYLVSQMANLYHSFGICIHRFITVRNREKVTLNAGSSIMCIYVQILAIWAFSIASVGVMFALYGADYNDKLPYCSLNRLFEERYERMLTYMCSLCLTPQLSMDVLYLIMCRYLVVNWRTTAKCSQNIKRTDAHMYKEINRIKYDMVDSQSRKVGRPIGSCIGCIHNVRKGLASEIKARFKNRLNCFRNHGNAYHKNSYNTQTHKRFRKRETSRETNNTTDNDTTYLNVQQCTSLNAETSFIECCGDTINRTNQSANKEISIKFRSLGSRRHQRSVLVTIGIMCLIMNICVTPFTTLFAIERAHDALLSRNVKFCVVTLALLNSALNPFVYAARITPFRIALRNNCQRLTLYFFRR